MDAPSWRSVEFYEDIVQGELTAPDVGPAVVTGLHIDQANKETEGYMSLIHRATVTVTVGPDREPRTYSYIVKEKSENTFGGPLVELLAVFPKEREFYERLLPAFERFWRAEDVRFGPKMFRATEGIETVIVMEDLKRSQYRMSARRFGLPMADVKRILTKLAKFHASSVLYREAGGAFSELFADGIFTEKTIDVLGGHYEVLYSAFLQSLRERNFPEKYLAPLSAIEGRLLNECCRVLRFDPADLNVLNHGDLWPNNMMFGDDDLLFLDFQTAYYGCFAADLLYFFITSATEIVADALDELLRYYHQELTAGLQKLGYRKPIPTVAELLVQTKKYGVLMLPPLAEAVAVTMAGVKEAADMETIISGQLDGGALRKRVFNNPSYVALVDRLFPTLFEAGLLSNLTEGTQ